MLWKNIWLLALKNMEIQYNISLIFILRLIVEGCNYVIENIENMYQNATQTFHSTFKNVLN